MQDVPFFLARLSARGVALFVDGEALRFRGPSGALTEDDRGQLRALKPAIIAHLEARAAARRPEIPPQPDAPIPASLIQRVWIRLMRSPHTPGMEKLPLVLSFRGVDPDRAEAAVRRLVTRHETLRSCFPSEGWAPRLSLLDPQDLVVRRWDAPDDEAFQARLFELVDPPLRLDEGWLVRPAVIRRSGGEIAVAILFHHIVCDGAGLEIVIRELYADLAGEPVPPPRTQYTDFARAEDVWYGGGAGEILSRHVRARIEDIPRLHSPSGVELTWLGGRRSCQPVELAPDTGERIAEAAARFGTTPFVVVVCAYARALAAWSGQDRFAIRSVGDLRTTHALSDTVGMMTCTDVMDVRMARSGGFEELAGRIAAEHDAAVAIRLPAQPGPDGWRDFREIVGATINYLPYSPPPVPPAGLEIAAPPYLAQSSSSQEKPPAALPYAPVFLRLMGQKSGLSGRWEFNEPLVKPDEQSRLIEAFNRAVGEL